MKSKNLSLSARKLREVLHYDPESGIFTWLKRPMDTKAQRIANGFFNAKLAGKKAGKPKKDRNNPLYMTVTINQRQFYNHRLAWLYMTGCQPPSQIDHIDGDGTNNAWNNLRDGTNTNRYNLAKYSNNTSGVTGVSKDRSLWRAVIRHEGVVYRLGRFQSIEDAENAVLLKRRELGVFTHDHGVR